MPVAFGNRIGMRFVLIPAGTFLMGDSEQGLAAVRREVVLTEALYVGVTEVTNAQYRRFRPSHDSAPARLVPGAIASWTLQCCSSATS